MPTSYTGPVYPLSRAQPTTAALVSGHMLFTAAIRMIADSVGANPVALQLAEHHRRRRPAPQIVTERLADIDHVEDRLVAHARVVERRDEVVLVGTSRNRQRHRPAHCEHACNNPTSAHDPPSESRREANCTCGHRQESRSPVCLTAVIHTLFNRGMAVSRVMTITPTETPRLANRAERKVYQALVEQLQPNDLVIPGQRVTDHLKDHEVDFVVAIEGAGIVCLEVKGGEVWHDGAGWCQLRGGKHVHIEPVRQAREACYALRDYIESDPRWTIQAAPLGPRRRPTQHPTPRRLLAARMPALEDHRPHRAP